MSRDCGGCTECCTLLPIEPFDKPGYQKCQHECAAGCAIYDTKPECCNQFTCAWREADGMAKSWRPDKTGIVVWFTFLIGTNGERTPVLRATRRDDSRMHRQTRQYLMAMSYQVPIQIEVGEMNSLWQDGEELIQWHNDDFVQMDLDNGKFVDPRVVPASEVLATDAQRERWQQITEQSKTVLEPGEQAGGTMMKMED